MTEVIVAIIGLIGTIGGAIIITKLGRVEKMVNGRLAKLIEMIEERDRQIAKLKGEQS